MSEFKAQILGVLIVIGVFGILVGLYETLIKDTVKSVSQEISEVIS